MVTKFRLFPIVFASAVGSLAMILPAAWADRDYETYAKSLPRLASITTEESQAAHARPGEDGGDASLLVMHDVLYQPCADGGDCSSDHGDGGNSFRADLISGEPPPNTAFLGGGSDEGDRGAGQGDQNASSSIFPALSVLSSDLFPFLPSIPLLSPSHDGASNLSGLGEGFGGAPGLPGAGSGGDGPSISITSTNGAEPSSPGTSSDTSNAVPEPATASVLTVGFLALALYRACWRQVFITHDRLRAVRRSEKPSPLTK